MQKADKERVVAVLAERLRSASSLIVADYRGLSNGQLAALRGELVKHGARLTVVKNTLTRRAAREAGADALLAMLEGPTAIAFVEAEGDPVAVAKALSESSRLTKVLTLRGGILSGGAITQDEVERLAKLPALDVLQAQLVGVIVAPLSQLVAVLNAPLQNLVGLIDARIAQLGDLPGAGAAAADAPAGDDERVVMDVQDDQPEPTQPESAHAESTQPDPHESAQADLGAGEESESEAEEPAQPGATATDTE